MLKLYHWWSSTCSRRVRIALAAKGLSWDSVYINLARFENLEPWYVELNPNGVVPTLVHDGRIIIESNFILEYLDDVWPEVPMRPDDPYERARMRFWMDRFEHELHRNVNIISFIKQGRIKRYEHMSEEERQASIMQQPTEPKRALLADRLKNGITEEQMAYAEARLAEILDEVEKALADRPWLNGGHMSLADCSIAPFIERFESNKLERLVDWNARPGLGAWWARMQATEAYRTAHSFKAPAA
jgi:glutathione S-transferase